MKAVGVVALLLTVIGGLNWGLVGFFGFNLVEAILGAGTVATAVVYDVVGLSALWTLVDWFTKRNAE